MKDEDLPFLDQLEKLGKTEDKDRGEMIVIAIREYVERHCPGQPQLTFDQQASLVFPEAARDKGFPKCHCGGHASRRVVLHGGEVVFCCSLHIPKHGVKFWRELK